MDYGFDKRNILNQDMKEVVESGTFTVYVRAAAEKDLQKIIFRVK